MKKYDVTALGELLIDFTENGISAQGNPLFEANPGGAPCNVLAMLAGLNKRTAFIGKIGKDMFGDMLRSALDGIGIDTENLISDGGYNTTLAFVHTLADGDREFSFYRDFGADMMLSAEEVNADIIKNSRIFHFGTLSSMHPVCREATRYAVNTAAENGVMISFDPNLRENLWKSLDNARAEIIYGLSKCNILKISDNELEFLCGKTADYDIAMNDLMKTYKNIKIAFLTCGADGSRAYYKGITEKADAVSSVKVIDTTGAGDTFTGCALSRILDYGIENFNEKILKETLIFANAGAAFVTEKKGALKVMPTKDEIYALAAEL
ncbi:MAG: carbohydrate kinase [Oscillospiraceae bacterium]|nr:carbohydrate kinase [Oscillospiraceae bacterium]